MPMTVRDKRSGEYATEDGWTKDRELARDFLRLDYAILYRDNQPNATDLLVIYHSGKAASNYDVTW